MKIFAAFSLLLALFVAACGINLNVNVDDQGNIGVSVQLDETRVNDIVRNTVTNDNNAPAVDRLSDIDSVDLKPGIITVFGTYRRADGTEIDGSFDLAAAAENGALRTRIVAVNFPGLNLESPEIVRANQELERAFSDSAAQSNEVRFDSVEITDTEMKLVITVLNQGQ